mgnify:CR=1 FL=1
MSEDIARKEAALKQQIVDIIRRLEDSGEITIHGDEEEERFIQ